MNAFKAWFGDSKVVDAAGAPLVVYHGTKGKFTSFLTPAWFTPNPHSADMFSADWGDGERTSESKVISVFIRIENPVHTDEWEVTEPNEEMFKRFEHWKQEGRDGIIFTSPEGEIEYIVFDPSQIKSATNNNGEYDGNNPDIRFRPGEDDEVSEAEAPGEVP